MTIDDRTLELGLADLMTTAPTTLAPGVLVEVGLADRFARMDSPIGPLIVAWNGLGRVRPWSRPVTTRRSRPSTPPGPDARPTRRARCPPGLRVGHRAPARRRPAGPDRPRPARPHGLRARRLGEGPRDPARRGPAVRLDRGRDRPAEGRAGRRDGAGPQPGPAHRAVPSRRPDRRLDRPVLAGRAGQQADDPVRRGPRSGRPRGPGPDRRPVRRLGHDPHRVPPDVPQREADHRRRTGSRSGRSRTPWRPGIVPAWPAGRPPARASPPPEPGRGPARRTMDIGVRDVVDSALGPARYANCSATPDPGPSAIWAGMLVLYVVWGSTYLAIAIAVDDVPAVHHGRHPVRPGRRRSCSPGRSSRDSIGRSCGRPGASGATRPSSAPCCSVAGWGSSPGESRPSRPASRPCIIATMPVWIAVLGGIFLGERLPRLAVAGIVIGFAGVAILVGPSAFGGVGAHGSGRPGGDPALAGRLGVGLAVRVASRDPAAAVRSSRPGPRWSPAALVLAVMGAASAGSGRRSTRPRSRGTRSSPSSTSRSSAASSRTRPTAGCSGSLPCPSSRPTPT